MLFIGQQRYKILPRHSIQLQEGFLIYRQAAGQRQKVAFGFERAVVIGGGACAMLFKLCKPAAICCCDCTLGNTPKLLPILGSPPCVVTRGGSEFSILRQLV
jgi:hypothetical protein